MRPLLASLGVTLIVASLAWGATIITTLTNDSWEHPLCCHTIGVGHETTRAGVWSQQLAWSFVAPSNATTDGADLALDRHWNTTVFPGNEVTISLHADTAGGVPGAVLQTVTLTDALSVSLNEQSVPDARFVPLVRATWPSPQALVAGTTYWLVVQSPDTTHATWYNAQGIGAAYQGSDGPFCGQGRVGTGMLWRTGYADGAWVPMFRNHLYDQCSLAFRITSP